MKILLCHPGAIWSVADVFNGYHGALMRAGHTVVDYALSGRIVTAGSWLGYSWKKSGLPVERKPTQRDVLYLAGQGLLERALRHQVEWVLIISAMYLQGEVLMLMRRAGIRLAAIMTESPYDDKNQKVVAGLLDCVFTNERTSVETFREACPSAHYLAHAYDPKVHCPQAMSVDAADHDVVFVGTGFSERINMLRAVDWDGIDLGLYGNWMLLGSRNRLRKHLQAGIVPNEQTAALYRRAKIGLNIHRTSEAYGRETSHTNGAESVNPRVVELAACETFCLSDWRAEMGDMFGDYVPRFTDGASLQEAIGVYLDDPEARARVARQMREDIQGHTFDVRAKQVVKALEAT